MAGKVALITGAARGIGRGVAADLLRNDAWVCLVDILSGELSQTEADLRKEFGDDRVISVAADITKAEEFREAFRKTVSKFGKLDILVNNAGIQKEGQWELMMDINLSATVRGTLLALEYMDPGKGGVVLNVSSNSGVNVSHPRMSTIPVYTATKAAVVAYTRCFASNKDVVAKKIRITCVCPIGTDTAILEDRAAEKCWDVEEFYSTISMDDLMTPADVASIMIQLLQDDTNSGKVALIEGVNKYKFV